MKINVYGDDVYHVIREVSPALSKKYYHTFCGTPHLFLAIFSFLGSKKDENERYNGIYTKMKNVLNEYNINGKTFEKSFLEYCPVGVEPEPGVEFEITVDTEFSLIMQNLNRNAAAQQRTMEMEDLIVELFGDSGYTIFTMFSDVTKSDMKTEEMRQKMIQAFKKATRPEIKELEEIPELTNLNKWIMDHPQAVIDADDEIKKIEMALAGRSIRNALLTGPAGTGKTTYVHEFVQRIVNGTCSEMFRDKIVYELSSTALVAGTRLNTSVVSG